MSVRKGNDVLAGSAPIKIDSVLSQTSANPVQNSVLVAKFQTVDSSIGDLSSDVETINDILPTKQDNINAGDGITITNTTVAVSDLDCGTMS